MPDVIRKTEPVGPTIVPARDVREYLIFTLSGEPYAVELDGIKEIVSPPALTEVPRAPRDIMGICSVRGLLLTVIDLRRRLRLTEQPQTRLSRILQASSESGELVGLFVDEVRHVVKLSRNDIEVAHAILGGDLSDHVLGIARPESEVIVILDLARVTA